MNSCPESGEPREVLLLSLESNIRRDLVAIRDLQLFRETHGTFPEYLRDRLAALETEVAR